MSLALAISLAIDGAALNVQKLASARCEMDDKLKMQRALLDHLERESEKIQSLMDELLKSMDTIPSEQRHGPAWEANTNRFLELVERSGDIARKLQLGSDAIKKGATGRKPS